MSQNFLRFIPRIVASGAPFSDALGPKVPTCDGAHCDCGGWTGELAYGGD